jgi:hypothetical protein
MIRMSKQFWMTYGSCTLFAVYITFGFYPKFPHLFYDYSQNSYEKHSYFPNLIKKMKAFNSTAVYL